MRYFRFLIIPVATLFAIVNAQGFQSYTFEDIKWLSAPAVVVSKLEAAGYTVDDPEPNENDAITFSGSLLGKAVSGTAHFGVDQLLKVDLQVPAEDGAGDLSQAELTYTQLKNTLSEQYGPPTRETGTVTGWITEEIGGYVGGIVLVMQEDANITVAYESPRWAFALAQGRGEGTDAF